MKIKLKYKEAVVSIDDMLRKLPENLEDQKKVVLKKIGKIVKGHVVKVLDKSDVEARAKQISPSNYDGTKPYIHMKDDVEYTIKKNDMGYDYVSIKGGKYTGYKWIILDAGHIARDGTTFVPGNNFASRAVSAAEGEVDAMINSLIQQVVK